MTRRAGSVLVTTVASAALAIGLAGCRAASSTALTSSTAPIPSVSGATSMTPRAASPATAQSRPQRTSLPARVRARTLVVTLEPVRRSGLLAAGWSAGPVDTSLQVDCSTGTSSPAALSGGVLLCSPSAASADACWASASAGVVLCLQDPWSHHLARYVPVGAVPRVAAARHALPLGLELADGRHCRLRNGGSGVYQQRHQGWVEWYYCDHSVSLAVWGPQNSESPIERSTPRWTVPVGTATDSLRTVDVVKAYYVATAS